MIRRPDPYYVETLTPEDFLLGMLTLGKPLEISYVGAFDKLGRGSRRDIDLPLHRDGVYSKELAAVQGGFYVEKEGIDFVGLYCLNTGKQPCFTRIGTEDRLIDEIDLQKGQALIFDNRQVLHGRRGPIGERILLRVWVSSSTFSI